MKKEDWLADPEILQVETRCRVMLMRLCEEGWRGGWQAVRWGSCGGARFMLWRKGGEIDDSPVCLHSESKSSLIVVIVGRQWSSKVSLWVEVGGLLRNREQRIISVCGW